LASIDHDSDGVQRNAIDSGAFLLLGVEKKEDAAADRNLKEKRPKTEGGRAKSAKKRQRVSYKTYQLCPRSWRPASSIFTGDDNDDDNTVIADNNSAEYDFPTPRDRPHTSPGLGALSTPRRPYLHSRNGATQGAAFPLFSRSGTPTPLARLRGDDAADGTTPRNHGAASRGVVVDGDDMTCYDDDDDDVGREKQRDDDESALKQLEWELASETGRLTADGEILGSRMSFLGEGEGDGDDSDDSGLNSNGSASLERLRLQLQRELFIDSDGLTDGQMEGGSERASDYDDVDEDNVEEEFHKLKYKMEAEREVSKLK